MKESRAKSEHIGRLKSELQANAIVAQFWEKHAAYTDVYNAVELLVQEGIVDPSQVDTDDSGKGAFHPDFSWPVITFCEAIIEDRRNRKGDVLFISSEA